MSKELKDPFENLQKTMLALQQAAKPIIEIQKKMTETFKPLIQFTSQIQKQLEPLRKIQDLLVQYAKQLRENFVATISIIEPPESYQPDKTTLSEGAHNTALNMAIIVDEIDTHPFCYLKERMLIGINAHLQKNYHLSLFAIFSAIDGMLTWFYIQNHPKMPIPDINQKLNVFFETYDFEHVVGENEIRPKFENFFKHRNEIMHGGENSYFDKNLSTAALLFLGIVFSSLTEDL